MIDNQVANADLASDDGDLILQDDRLPAVERHEFGVHTVREENGNGPDGTVGGAILSPSASPVNRSRNFNARQPFLDGVEGRW